MSQPAVVQTHDLTRRFGRLAAVDGVSVELHANALYGLLGLPFLLLAMLGALIGAIYQHWRATGIYVASVLAILAVGALIVLVSYRNGWAGVGHWLDAQSTLALFAGWPALASVPVAAGYLVIRRANPA